MTPAPFHYSLAPFIAFRDLDACARVRAIRRADIARHVNPAFRIEVIETPLEFFSRFAVDIVSRISRTRDEGRRCVLILPVGPVPRDCRRHDYCDGFHCRHSVTFNMDEYADDQGRTAPAGWEGSFATSMRQSFFAKIDPDLRPPDANIHFPTDRNIADYWKLIEDAGGADCCYSGIGWCRHIAFWESSRPRVRR